VGVVVEGLACGAFFARRGGEIGAGGLHCHDELTGPEKIDATGAAAFTRDGVLELGVHGTAVATEDGEELVEESFGVGRFARGTGPVLGKGEGA